MFIVACSSSPQAITAQTIKTPVMGATGVSGKWLVYSDPRFGFTLEYPANWTVEPRTDEPHRAGEVLIFRSPPVNDDQTYSIAIGQYPNPIGATESLSVWIDEYNQRGSAFSPDQIKTFVRQNVQVDNSEALFIHGASPLTEYRYTIIRRGTTVWFIWSNIGDSAGELFVEIYDHVLGSFRFGDKHR